MLSFSFFEHWIVKPFQFFKFLYILCSILTCFIQVYCYFLVFPKGVWWILSHAPPILLVISSSSKLFTRLFVTIPNALKTIGFISHNFVTSLAIYVQQFVFFLKSLSDPLEQRNLLNIFLFTTIISDFLNLYYDYYYAHWGSPFPSCFQCFSFVG